MMDESTTEDEFRSAVTLIKNLPKTGSIQPSDGLKLKFYSYYKQATEGPCTIAKPAFWDIVNRAKWNAWSGLGDMTREDAMRSYIDEFLQVFLQVIETMPCDGSATSLVHLMGPLIKYAPRDVVESLKLINGNRDELPNHENEAVMENTHVSNSNLRPLKGKDMSGKKNDKNDFLDKEPEAGIPVSSNLNGHSINGGNESDSEEFSDTFDKVNRESDEDIISQANTVNEASYNPPINTTKGTNIIHVRGGGDQRPNVSDRNSPIPSTSGSRGSRQPHLSRVSETPSQRLLSGNTSGGSGGSRRSDENVSFEPASDVNEQLALAVIRLQHTMEQVVSRLDSLEVLLQERRSNPCKQVSKMNNSFWSMFGLSPSAAFLILAWPFIAQWLFIYVMEKRRRR